MKIRILILGILGFAVLGALVGCGYGGGKSGGSPHAESPFATGAPEAVATDAPTGGRTGETAGEGPTVVERDIVFRPAVLEVNVGDTVTFTNQDPAPHNVLIDEKELGVQAEGKSVTWIADRAGTFPYQCLIHPNMTGVITVK